MSAARVPPTSSAVGAVMLALYCDEYGHNGLLFTMWCTVEPARRRNLHTQLMDRMRQLPQHTVNSLHRSACAVLRPDLLP